jgi:hypothetical protein
MSSASPTLHAVLRLSSGKKPTGWPIYAGPSGRLWLLLDEEVQALETLDWVSLTDLLASEEAWDKRQAAHVLTFGRLCAVRVAEPFAGLAFSTPPLRASDLPSGDALGFLRQIGNGRAALDVLANVVRHLDVVLDDAAGPERIEEWLASFSLSALARLGDPTKLAFERGDTLLAELEEEVLRAPLTILIGGASSGRTALAKVLEGSKGRVRYLAGNNVSGSVAQMAADVEEKFAENATLIRSELASLLTALVLAVLERTGPDVGMKAFPRANVTQAFEPSRAFAQFIVSELRSQTRDGGAAAMLAVFFRLLEDLIGASDGTDVTTVLLPFEKLEQEWTRRSYPKLWVGLKNLAFDLQKRATGKTGRVRLLVMARSVPFQEIGKQGLSTWVLAMPPLDRAETSTRLTEFACCTVDEQVVDQVYKSTGGLPVLTAALLHALPLGKQLSIEAVAGAVARITDELRKACRNEVVGTLSGRLLRQFVMKVQLDPGDDGYFLNLAGGDVYLDDDLGDAFHRLFRAGVLWFKPVSGHRWSALKQGSEFQLAAPSELLIALVATLAARAGTLEGQ